MIPKYFLCTSPVLLLGTILFDGLIHSASSEIVLPGRCYQGSCFETLFGGKALLERDLDGNLYAIEMSIRWLAGGPEPTDRIERREETYVYCSTVRPAFIRPESPGSSVYTALFLNPGGQPSGASMSVYPIYWTTCHNLVGPRFDIGEERAREMGYSLNLRESQITINDPRDILR